MSGYCLHKLVLLLRVVAAIYEDEVENDVVFLQIDAPATFVGQASAVAQGAQKMVTRHKVASGLAQPSPPPPPITYRQPLSNYMDIVYLADMVVGGQKLTGILDTGSYELLVLSTKCNTCGDVDLLYNSSKSSTYQVNHSIRHKHSFGSGDTVSTLAYEHVDIGPLAIEKQYFWEVTDAMMPILKEFDFQAIVGVGPVRYARGQAWKMVQAATLAEDIAENNNATAAAQIFEEERDHALVLTQQKVILENLDASIFSVCLKRGQGEPGYFVWNDVDPSEDARFQKMSVLGKEFWGAELGNVQFNGGKSDSHWDLACASGCSAILDSGTSVIALPTAMELKAFSFLNTLEDVSCHDISEYPNLDFELDGKKFSLPPQAYIFEVVGQSPDDSPFKWSHVKKETRCTLGFITMDLQSEYGPVWIAGMPFFKEYYTTFHLPGNGSKRSMYAATSDDNCNPSANGTSGNSRSNRQLDQPIAVEASYGLDFDLAVKRQPIKAKRVDLAKMMIPPWLREAAKKRRIEF